VRVGKTFQTHRRVSEAASDSKLRQRFSIRILAGRETFGTRAVAIRSARVGSKQAFLAIF